MPTDQAGTSGVFPCDTVLSNQTISRLGHNAQVGCIWVSDAAMRVQFGNNASLPLGGDVEVQGGVLRAKQRSSELNAAARVPLEAPRRFERVVATLTAPPAIGPCQELVLSMQDSLGAGGRPWQLEYGVTARSAVDGQIVSEADIRRTIRAASAAQESSVAFPAGSLQPGVEYTFAMQATNWVGLTDATTCVVRVSHAHRPQLRVLGPRGRRYSFAEEITLEVFTEVPDTSCDPMSPFESSNMTYQWSMVAGPIPSATSITHQMNKGRPTLVIPAYSLEPLHNYTFQLTASISSVAGAASTVAVEAEVETTYAEISVGGCLGADRTHAAAAVLTVTARPEDPMWPATAPLAPAWQLQWRCEGKCLGSSCAPSLPGSDVECFPNATQLLEAANDRAELLLPAGTLTPGWVYVLSCTAARAPLQPGRTKRAEVRIMALGGSAPSVDIVNTADGRPPSTANCDELLELQCRALGGASNDSGVDGAATATPTLHAWTLVQGDVPEGGLLAMLEPRYGNVSTNTDVLAVAAGSLGRSQHYVFRCTVEGAAGSVGWAEVTVHVNQAPSSGRLVVGYRLVAPGHAAQPWVDVEQVGRPLDADGDGVLDALDGGFITLLGEFSFYGAEWADMDAPLRYSFEYRLPSEPEFNLLSEPGSTARLVSFLPAGEALLPGGLPVVEVQVAVHDARGCTRRHRLPWWLVVRGVDPVLHAQLLGIAQSGLEGKVNSENVQVLRGALRRSSGGHRRLQQQNGSLVAEASQRNDLSSASLLKRAIFDKYVAAWNVPGMRRFTELFGRMYDIGDEYSVASACMEVTAGFAELKSGIVASLSLAEVDMPITSDGTRHLMCAMRQLTWRPGDVVPSAAQQIRELAAQKLTSVRTAHLLNRARLSLAVEPMARGAGVAAAAACFAALLDNLLRAGMAGCGASTEDQTSAVQEVGPLAGLLADQLGAEAAEGAPKEAFSHTFITLEAQHLVPTMDATGELFTAAGDLAAQYRLRPPAHAAETSPFAASMVATAWAISGAGYGEDRGSPFHYILPSDDGPYGAAVMARLSLQPGLHSLTLTPNLAHGCVISAATTFSAVDVRQLEACLGFPIDQRQYLASTTYVALPPFKHLPDTTGEHQAGARWYNASRRDFSPEGLQLLSPAPSNFTRGQGGNTTGSAEEALWTVVELVTEGSVISRYWEAMPAGVDSLENFKPELLLLPPAFSREDEEPRGRHQTARVVSGLTLLCVAVMCAVGGAAASLATRRRQRHAAGTGALGSPAFAAAEAGGAHPGAQESAGWLSPSLHLRVARSARAALQSHFSSSGVHSRHDEPASPIARLHSLGRANPGMHSLGNPSWQPHVRKSPRIFGDTPLGSGKGPGEGLQHEPNPLFEQSRPTIPKLAPSDLNPNQEMQRPHLASSIAAMDLSHLDNPLFSPAAATSASTAQGEGATKAAGALIEGEAAAQETLRGALRAPQGMRSPGRDIHNPLAVTPRPSAGLGRLTSSPGPSVPNPIYQLPGGNEPPRKQALRVRVTARFKRCLPGVHAHALRSAVSHAALGCMDPLSPSSVAEGPSRPQADADVVRSPGRDTPNPMAVSPHFSAADGQEFPNSGLAGDVHNPIYLLPETNRPPPAHSLVARVGARARRIVARSLRRRRSTRRSSAEKADTACRPALEGPQAASVGAFALSAVLAAASGGVLSSILPAAAAAAWTVVAGSTAGVLHAGWQWWVQAHDGATPLQSLRRARWLEPPADEAAHARIDWRTVADLVRATYSPRRIPPDHSGDGMQAMSPPDVDESPSVYQGTGRDLDDSLQSIHVRGGHPNYASQSARSPPPMEDAQQRSDRRSRSSSLDVPSSFLQTLSPLRRDALWRARPEEEDSPAPEALGSPGALQMPFPTETAVLAGDVASSSLRVASPSPTTGPSTSARQPAPWSAAAAAGADVDFEAPEHAVPGIHSPRQVSELGTDSALEGSALSDGPATSDGPGRTALSPITPRSRRKILALNLTPNLIALRGLPVTELWESRGQAASTVQGGEATSRAIPAVALSTPPPQPVSPRQLADYLPIMSVRSPRDILRESTSRVLQMFSPEHFNVAAPPENSGVPRASPRRGDQAFPRHGSLFSPRSHGNASPRSPRSDYLPIVSPRNVASMLAGAISMISPRGARISPRTPRRSPRSLLQPPAALSSFLRRSLAYASPNSAQPVPKFPISSAALERLAEEHRRVSQIGAAGATVDPIEFRTPGVEEGHVYGWCFGLQARAEAPATNAVSGTGHQTPSPRETGAQDHQERPRNAGLADMAGASPRSVTTADGSKTERRLEEPVATELMAGMIQMQATASVLAAVPLQERYQAASQAAGLQSAGTCHADNKVKHPPQTMEEDDGVQEGSRVLSRSEGAPPAIIDNSRASHWRGLRHLFERTSIGVFRQSVLAGNAQVGLGRSSLDMENAPEGHLPVLSVAQHNTSSSTDNDTPLSPIPTSPAALDRSEGRGDEEASRGESIPSLVPKSPTALDESEGRGGERLLLEELASPPATDDRLRQTIIRNRQRQLISANRMVDTLQSDASTGPTAFPSLRQQYQSGNQDTSHRSGSSSSPVMQAQSNVASSASTAFDAPKAVRRRSLGLAFENAISEQKLPAMSRLLDRFKLGSSDPTAEVPESEATTQASSTPPSLEETTGEPIDAMSKITGTATETLPQAADSDESDIQPVDSDVDVEMDDDHIRPSSSWWRFW
ncbi:hypothetical protein CYMTET_18850 [Cymbomonas tetramitiformis]|uniref:PKD/REJ-like domain-containing protein n=1 Tax=Cymbomonas tetramitiformis TaxID=36881 RepID=A0AAE0G7N1_9CHLO|nr:hypothetical protein CYMTET_18850 [Cymbomonas tetramitiformis]